MVLYKTVRHYFPEFRKWFKGVSDCRNPNSIEYSAVSMLWVGILMFIFKLQARRQINFEMNTGAMVKNISTLTREKLTKIPHDSAVAYLFERLNPDEISKIRTRMVNQLIRKKCFEKYRLFGEYLIAMDGSRYLSFHQQHCPQCLTTDNQGNISYYHSVLEAKLVSQNGMAFSTATEFVENVDNSVGKKQDCELRAFYRLTARLKEQFPQLRICLLLDGLYANQQVFEICSKNNWHYIITFKEGSLPATFQEYSALKELNEHCSGNCRYGDALQNYHWVNDIDYEGQRVNVLECEEIKHGEKKTFIWLTNFTITSSNYYQLANKGGRLRWKIENEGFNVQKNGGYNMEHPYSEHPIALKIFYLLLQIAHIINQLVECGSLLSEQMQKSIGSIRNISRRLLESFRNTLFDPNEIQLATTVKFQIRLRGP